MDIFSRSECAIPERRPRPPLKVEALSADHDLTAFDCGVESLNNWLKNNALKNQKNGASRTYVTCDGQNRVTGYYCVSASEIRKPDGEAAPVALIGRLAIDRAGKRANPALSGSALLHEAFARIAHAADHGIECRAVVVEALPQAISFYDKHKFTGLDGERLAPASVSSESCSDNKAVPMILPMAAVRTQLCRDAFKAMAQDMAAPLLNMGSLAIRMGYLAREELPTSKMRQNMPGNVPYLLCSLALNAMPIPTEDQIKSRIHAVLDMASRIPHIGFCGVAFLDGMREQSISLWSSLGFKQANNAGAAWVLPLTEMSKTIASLGIAGESQPAGAHPVERPVVPAAIPPAP